MANDQRSPKDVAFLVHTGNIPQGVLNTVEAHVRATRAGDGYHDKLLLDAQVGGNAIPPASVGFYMGDSDTPLGTSQMREYLHAVHARAKEAGHPRVVVETPDTGATNLIMSRLLGLTDNVRRYGDKHL